MKMFILEKTARTVRLNVVLDDGRCTLATGTPLPKLKKGASAELVVYALDLLDENERKKLVSERNIPFLPAGTTLWARVKEDDIPRNLLPHRKEMTVYPVVPDHFVAFVLEEDLQLKLRAAKGAVLVDCKCGIPSLNLEAKSVNEAYTRISIAFEPSRRSHTGNAFTCVFIEKENRLHPLENLRMAKEEAST
jgi:hypothetical protein